MPSQIDQQQVHAWNDKERWGREALVRTGYPKLWRMAINALQNKGSITNPDGANVKVNRFISDIKMVLARDAKFLLGTEPYFPLESKLKDYGDTVRLQEHALNEAILDARGYLPLLDCLFQAGGLGVSYLMAEWDVQVITKKKRQMAYDPIFGLPSELQKVEETTTQEGFKLTSLGVDDTIPAPIGNTIEEMPYFIAKRLVSFSEVIRLIDSGKIEIPDDISTKDLKRGPDFHGGEEWMKQWRRDKGLGEEEDRGEVMVLCQGYGNPTEEFPEGQVYWWLNYWIGIRQRDGGMDNCPKTFKPFAMFRNLPYPLGPDKRFGMGMFEQAYDLAQLGDDYLSLWIDAIGKDTSPPVLIDNDLVNPSDVTYRRANRIPFNYKGDQRTINDAIKQLPRQAVNDKLYEAWQMTKTEGDARIGKFPYQTGEPPPRKETFGTSQILASAGDAVVELHTRYMELTGMTDAGNLLLKVLDANVEPWDYNRYMSEDDAAKLLSLDPETLPGGYRFRFKGSASVMREVAENEALDKWWQGAANDPLLADPILPRRTRAERLRQFNREDLDAMYPAWNVHPMNPANQVPPEQVDEFGNPVSPNPGVAGPEMIENDLNFGDMGPRGRSLAAA